MWCVNTKEYLGEDGRVKALKCVRVEWEDTPGGRPRPVEVPGSEFEIQADLVLLAMGFVHPEHGGLIEQLGVELDERGNVATGDPKHTNVEGVFAAGDMRRGQSLVVTALAEGRDMAYDVDEWLMGESILPRSNPR
jgi:glutamate synthase (NADPH/NADH) small chain